MKLFKPSILAAALMAAAGVAQADPLIGTGTGTLGPISNCSNLTRSGQATIAGCQLSNGNTKLSWGDSDQSNTNGLTNPSTLTADTVNINATTSTSNLLVGQLTWYNSPTRSDRTDSDFGFDWKLTLAFTSPNAQSTTYEFDLNVRNTENTPDDPDHVFSLEDISNLSLLIGGYKLENFRYVAADGAGSNGNNDTKLQAVYTEVCKEWWIQGVLCKKKEDVLSGYKWINDESNTAYLRVYADMTAPPPPPPPTNVPVPAPLALMGLACAGLALTSRRRGSK